MVTVDGTILTDVDSAIVAVGSIVFVLVVVRMVVVGREVPDVGRELLPGILYEGKELEVLDSSDAVGVEEFEIDGDET